MLSELTIEEGERPMPWSSAAVSWDPHSAGSAAVASGEGFFLVDTQSMQRTMLKDKAHQFGIR